MEPLGQHHSHITDRILVLSANGVCAEPSGAQFISIAEELGWPVIESASAGPALREIALTRPAGVIVLVGTEHSLEPCASLIADLRRYQPHLPLVALTDHHNERAEQTLRTAGATAYVAGGAGGASSAASATEAAELIAAARPQRQPPDLVPRVFPAASRSPPKLCGRRAPPPRIRGQP